VFTEGQTVLEDKINCPCSKDYDGSCCSRKSFIEDRGRLGVGLHFQYTVIMGGPLLSTGMLETPFQGECLSRSCCFVYEPSVEGPSIRIDRFYSFS